MSNEQLVIVPIPSLVSVLLHHEQQKGASLTEQEVLDITEQAVCVAMPRDVAAQIAEGRGYDDIRPEHAWEDWKAIRPTLPTRP